MDGTTKALGWFSTPSSGNAQYNWPISTTSNKFDSNKVIAVTFDMSGGTASVEYYPSGVNASATRSTISSAPAAALTSNKYNIGARNAGASLACPLDLTDAVGFNALHNSTTIAAICAALAVQ